MENQQTVPEIPTPDQKRPLPSWLVFGVFSIVAFAMLIVLLIPLPFSDYIYKFESGAFLWKFIKFPWVVAGMILIGYTTFYLLRVFRRTARKPIAPGTVPVIERTIFGPLTLAALMIMCAEILARVIVYGEEGYSVTAAYSIAALFSSFPIAFLLHGLITFPLAQTRKRYAIMFFVSAAVIASMPILLKVVSPLANAIYNLQQSQDRTMTDRQLSETNSMKDCANVGGDFGWVECISTHMKSKADYLECLKQAPKKDGLMDEKGLSLDLCDREYETYLGNFTGHTYEMVNGERVTQETGTIDISECRDLARYRAWSICATYALHTDQDYNTCLQQAEGRADQFGATGIQQCNLTFVKSFTDYTACSNKMPADYQNLCVPLISKSLTAQTDVSTCYKLSTKQGGQYADNADSDATQCIIKLVELNQTNHEALVTICGYVAERYPIPAFMKGNPCPQNITDEYYTNVLSTINTIDQCAFGEKDTNIVFWRACAKKTIHSTTDFQTCMRLAQKQKYNQDSYEGYCREAWPQG